MPKEGVVNFVVIKTKEVPVMHNLKIGMERSLGVGPQYPVCWLVTYGEVFVYEELRIEIPGKSEALLDFFDKRLVGGKLTKVHFFKCW
jgi:hypothetical protein